MYFRYMYYKTGCTKPVKRLWVSSLEEKAIKKAFPSLKMTRNMTIYTVQDLQELKPIGLLG